MNESIFCNDMALLEPKVQIIQIIVILLLLSFIVALFAVFRTMSFENLIFQIFCTFIMSLVLGSGLVPIF